jgi:hypothetical protein
MSPILINKGWPIESIGLRLRDYTCTVTDLEILVVLVIRLLRQDFDRLVNGIEPVEL